jgi:dienelactone hydrolase
VLVEATVGDRRLVRTVQRQGLALGVHVTEVAEAGVVGRAFLPAGGGAPGPAAVVVGGSEGGVDSMSPLAAALASRGVPALVVGLFGAPGLPEALDEVPLEPLAAGAAWLASHTSLDPARLAAVGLSRGAEAVLAAAARLDGFSPSVVVGLSPGSTVWEALDAEGMGTGRSSWTVGGTALPFASVDDVAITRDLLHQAPRRALHRDLPQLMHLRAAYVGGLATAAAQAAAIPSEQIAGRLVLHAGGDDALWPADQMARALLDRRTDRTDDELTVHPGAGHLLRWPVVPTRPDQLGGLVFGGDPAGQAAAHVALARSVLSAVGGRPLGAGHEDVPAGAGAGAR